MSDVYLKKLDILPILEVALKTPTGAAVDLTAATGVKLHISLGGLDTVLTRNMTVFGSPTNGVVRYQWVTTDWNAGALIIGSHRMEYEVLGAASARQTYPNGGYDTLIVLQDLGQG